MGYSSGFIGCVGDDEIGEKLLQGLQSQGVNVVGPKIVSKPTRIAYVVLDKNRDRKFDHFTADCADEQILIRHLPAEFPGDAKVLHFGSISTIQQPSASTTFEAIAHAREQGTLMFYDPNRRPSLWPNEKACRQCILSTLPPAGSGGVRLSGRAQSAVAPGYS